VLVRRFSTNLCKKVLKLYVGSKNIDVTSEKCIGYQLEERKKHLLTSLTMTIYNYSMCSVMEFCNKDIEPGNPSTQTNNYRPLYCSAHLHNQDYIYTIFNFLDLHLRIQWDLLMKCHVYHIRHVNQMI
jgi:hypothetical protein